MAEPEHFSLINPRDQPVELLLPDGTLTLPPHGRVELPAAAVTAPQIQELCRRRLLTLRPIAAEPAEPAEPAEHAEPARRPARRRTR